MVAEIWRKTQPKILKFIFLPYMLFFLLFIIYISAVFTPKGERTLKDWIIQIPCLCFYNVTYHGSKATCQIRDCLILWYCWSHLEFTGRSLIFSCFYFHHLKFNGLYRGLKHVHNRRNWSILPLVEALLLHENVLENSCVRQNDCGDVHRH